ncbi:DUF2291 domain-containing protein [Caulobacter sp.]|uniref:DUF2291 family protein n=1 Tax=Caulobacter sp. TaxID=78 RepID=UPI00160BAB60
MQTDKATGRDSNTRRRLAPSLLLAVAAISLSACKVVPIAADRAARERLSGAFDAGRYVEAVWDAQAQPHWTKTAAPLPELSARIDQDIAAAGGRQAGDGSPWTFVTSGEGSVVSLDTTARAGRVVLDVPGSGAVTVLVGPVVSGSALRDSLPFVAFNDFSNQIAYAEVGGALTRRAVRDARPVAESLKPGDRVAFTGVFQAAKAGDPVVVTPIQLRRVTS